MKDMRGFSFKKYKNAIITIEIQSMIPERFINLLWKKGIYIKNITKKSVTTFIMDINLKDYNYIEDVAKRTDTRIKIIKRRGPSFLLLFLKKRIAFVIGIFLFVFMMYFMSTFIWGIDIKCNHTITPYEIRKQLNSYGVKPGINKNKINIYEIESKLIKDIDNIMWVKARVQGSKLVIKAEERQSPPKIIEDTTPCDLVAKKDGQIERIYTTAGTSVVNKGDMVRKGDVLVKGEQGKEEQIYNVHAKGKVLARTFYEQSKNIKKYKIQRIRTGKKFDNIYIKCMGKKIYIKKTVKKYDKYDKIESNKLFVWKETYYEVKQKKQLIDMKKAIDHMANNIYKSIIKRFDKSVNVVDKIVDDNLEGEQCRVRVLVIAQEDISVPKEIENLEENKEDNLDITKDKEGAE